MKQLISVIITTKNEEDNIGRLIKSIKNQSYKNFEIIVVDNFSTDNTVQVAKRLGVKVLSKGPERSAQRNFGVKNAKGESVLILDADMQLTGKVLEECAQESQKGYRLLIIPEKTVGEGFISNVRKFERKMYVNDPTIEVPRFFAKRVFVEFGGYDENLTGPEDYDLPYRISKKHKVGRINAYLNHHEEKLTLIKLLKKRFYYARKGAVYAQKHPELVGVQGNMLFRKAYIRHWRNFVKQPVLGINFIIVKILETISAVAGFISAVGILNFIKTFLGMFKRK